MSDVTMRLAILALLSVIALLLVWFGRRFVEQRRQRVLAVTPTLQHHANVATNAQISILVFSSEDCRQCHQLQAPALRRVVDARGELISIVEVDAPTSPELTERYQVLTVPTTIILDAAGKAHAVNYGFANAKRLLEQVDSVLATT
ncbi:MAG: thioredoxin family protein [Ktedonobacteraceae bacterium]